MTKIIISIIDIIYKYNINMLGIRSLLGSVSRVSSNIVNTCVNSISKQVGLQVRCMANHKHKKIIKEVTN